jgi:N-acetylglucosamine kinase-like BadF-type ATPase
MTALYLAVDGGNSKTDVVLGTTDGEVLGFVRGPTSSPHVIGLAGTVQVLDGLIRQACAAAGVGAGIDVLSVCLAGADLPIEINRLQEAVNARAWATRSIVDNDCFAMLRSGTSSPDAIVVVCGAGNNCVGRAADGRTARFPALGPISGDWGGGHDLAEHTLRLAARGEDGRGERTALSLAVARHFGRPTVESVSIALHLGDLPSESIRELCPLLFTVAEAGDRVARTLVRRQAHEIVTQHRVTADRLGLRDAPHALVLGGGVLRARHPLLHEQVVAGVRATSSYAAISVLAQAPVAGAALMALDALGTSATAEPGLREEIRRADPDGLAPLGGNRALEVGVEVTESNSSSMRRGPAT